MFTRTRRGRPGNTLILALLFLTGMLAMLAFAVDIGYLNVVRTDLQRTADAASMAAAWELIDEDVLLGNTSTSGMLSTARSVASNYAYSNRVGSRTVALAQQDVEFGYMANLNDPNAVLILQNPSAYNAVHVRVRRTADQNGTVPFFFAKVLGFTSMGVEANATAALVTSFSGFQAPASGENLDILPFALDEQTWQALTAGSTTDEHSWNPTTKTISNGSDGIREVNLYPQGTGSPGNRGTVDIGSSNNSTNDIARQIVHGVSPSDLAHHGGKLELDANGQLQLNGDTGISAGVKDELASIMGQPRIIPIFRTVVGPGNNAMYTIVSFTGVRIMSVRLTGSNKEVIIQPAPVVVRGGIPSTDPATSSFLFSPAKLVR
jgi:hypothetical protein